MILRLILTAVLAATVLAAAPAQAQDAAAAHETLTVQDRQVDVAVWPANGTERAVVVFSHGAGGEPRAYGRIIEAWQAAGFTVMAPLHVDSQAYPERGKYNLQQAFMLRIADLAAVRDLARARSPGVPLIAAGHSYGALMSAIAGGAVTAVGPRRDADVDAVILLSSTGRIPGLMRPDTFAGLAVPAITVTGDADVVDGYAADWTVHRDAFDQSGAPGRVILVFAGADHSFVRDADADDFALMAGATVDFVLARTANDAAAAARLDALAADGLTVERR
ncbi:alpha/beta hydrolase [Brevundimonas sp.]|jgi:alpha-beta hydrolase superfamily lysophospholipase|uniref:alpha/beta hydrolase n=1 Tax=Brevundimonas sp. TaxID=1871086 RepID=UPI002E1049F6|nr:alpha/beta hydrolase [Brevundimonas sp.]